MGIIGQKENTFCTCVYLNAYGTEKDLCSTHTHKLDQMTLHIKRGVSYLSGLKKQHDTKTVQMRPSQ